MYLLYKGLHSGSINLDIDAVFHGIGRLYELLSLSPVPPSYDDMDTVYDDDEPVSPRAPPCDDIDIDYDKKK